MQSRDAGAQAGFTLIELVVAMAAAIPLLIGLFTILIITLHQTQRTLTRVDATRLARNALATVENELHAACVGQNTDPILPGSTPTSLSFLSYLGTDDSPTPVWHVLSLVANAGSSPTSYSLVDKTYGVTADPNATNVGWDQGASTGSVTLLTNVTPLSSGTAFQYYAYKPYQSGSVYDWIIPDGTNLQPGTTSSYPNSSLSDPTSGGLSAINAGDAVEVKIGLLVGSSGQAGPGSAALSGTADSMTDSISLRLTTPPDSSTNTTDTGDFGPCE